MIPTHLYHYTTVENLLLILQTGKIRFKRLDKLNDPDEGSIKKFNNHRTFVFASCWTHETKDSLPLWKFYNDLKGVRIRMPIDLFNTTLNMSVSRLARGRNYLITSEIKGKEIFSYINQGIRSTHEIKQIYGPSEIKYFESQYDLDKEVVALSPKEADFELLEVNVNMLGQNKLDHWSFEKEYRYRIIAFNMTAGSEEVLEFTDSTFQIQEESIDIGYKKESLQNVEIMLGPKTTRESKKLIENQLKIIGIEDYSIFDSQIRIR